MTVRVDIPAAWGIAAVTAVCLALLPGCAEREPAPAASQPASRPAQVDKTPDVPDEFAEELNAGATEILVNTDAASAPPDKPTYIQKQDYPSGTLSGVCWFEGLQRKPRPPYPRLPVPEVLDLAAGPDAIKDPMPGEVNYYKNIKIRRPVYARARSGLFPTHVALMLRGVKVGRRPPLTPSGFMAMKGHCMALSGNYGDRTNLTFAPINTRVTFFTYEEYPCTWRVTRADTGKQLFEGKVAYKDLGKKNAHTVSAGHKIWILSKPKHIQSSILASAGLYNITTKRHPWKVGYVWLVDNPYVQVVSGSFVIKNVPVGKHRMDVWHPVYEPVARTVEFEIKLDETSEVALLFKAPDLLKSVPDRPKR
ncbi:hypothetical protein LCGC14_2794820 [marine sediment metagenome]|uniref:Uncharacterized protein n=1 Tax=marine sediment metagenome TaxID=412755 RepID=A0A0F8ZBH6_9ZZZZ